MKKLLSLSLLAMNFLAMNADAGPLVQCPSFLTSSIKALITQGRISTDSHTLADEAGLQPDEVIKDEPTANPYDTYYQITGIKNINNVPYLLYVGNILAHDNNEARSRAEKIIIGNETLFIGYPIENFCIYKSVDASPAIPSYPYKSHYETVTLIAMESINLPKNMTQTMFNIG